MGSSHQGSPQGELDGSMPTVSLCAQGWNSPMTAGSQGGIPDTVLFFHPCLCCCSIPLTDFMRQGRGEADGKSAS